MIEAQHDAGVAWLTLARPERGNALSEPLVEALIAEVERAVADEAVHTLLLRARGAHFCTGFDLGDIGDDGGNEAGTAADPTPDESGHALRDGPLLWRFVRIEHLLSLLWHAPLRTVALAQGRIWGAGADLFAACDLRLATPDAQWRFPGAGFGLVLGTRRLGVQVGPSRALAWVTEGARIDADAALAAGLATAITAELPADAAALPPLTVDRVTLSQLKSATRPDQHDVDMAALVHSAARPGLAARIRRYRQQGAAARARRDPGGG